MTELEKAREAVREQAEKYRRAVRKLNRERYPDLVEAADALAASAGVPPAEDDDADDDLNMAYHDDDDLMFDEDDDGEV